MAAVANDLTSALVVQHFGMAVDPVGHLGVNRLGQQALGPVVQDLGQDIPARRRNRRRSLGLGRQDRRPFAIGWPGHGPLTVGWQHRLGFGSLIHRRTPRSNGPSVLFSNHREYAALFQPVIHDFWS